MTTALRSVAEYIERDNAYRDRWHEKRHFPSRNAFYRRHHKAMVDHAAYADIVTVAEKLGWPEHYQTDLYVHDRAYIEGHAGQPFVWGVRPCGTHMVGLVVGEEEWLTAIMQPCLPDNRWYFWNGEELAYLGVSSARVLAMALDLLRDARESREQERQVMA